MNTSKRLHRLDALSDTHMGRQIQVAGLTGTLAGLVPCGGRIVVAMILGGAHAFTDALEPSTEVEIWRER